MNYEDAVKLVESWNTAISALWAQVIEKAKKGTVAVPVINEKIGGITIILSPRGIEVVVGSTGTRFVQLLGMPEFKLSDFVAIRKFIVDSIRKAHVDVEKAMEDRVDAFDTAFVDMKKEIAEWNLICEQGKELRT